MRREFEAMGNQCKTFKTEKRTRIKFIESKDGEKAKVEPEEYDYVTTTNHFRKFKKGKKQ